MGNTDLRDLAAIREISPEELAGGTVAVDFHNWLYRYLTIITKFTDEAAYTTSDETEVPNLLGIMQGLPKFTELGLQPVFVFDGEVLELKEDEMQRRRERKEDAKARLVEAKEAGNEELAARLRARTQRLTPTILETSREILDILDMPVVEAPTEAEAQAAHIAKRDDVDFVGTEDYDALLFGAPMTLRKLTSSDGTECMELEPTLADLDVTLPQLVDIAILCGTDYNDGVHGIGPKTALKKISAGTTVEEILADRDAEIEQLDVIRDIYLDPSVTDEYSIEWDWAPDFEQARSYLTEEWEIPAGRIETSFEKLESEA